MVNIFLIDDEMAKIIEPGTGSVSERELALITQNLGWRGGREAEIIAHTLAGNKLSVRYATAAGAQRARKPSCGEHAACVGQTEGASPSARLKVRSSESGKSAAGAVQSAKNKSSMAPAMAVWKSSAASCTPACATVAESVGAGGLPSMGSGSHPSSGGVVESDWQM